MDERFRGRFARLDPRDFFRGFAYAVTGFRLLRKYPELARYWLVPIVLTLLALCASFALALRYYDDALALLWHPPDGSGGWASLEAALYWLARGVSFVLTLAALGLCAVVLSTLLAAPFNDALSEAVEERETGRPSPPFSLRRVFKDTLRTVIIEAFKLFALASFLLPLAVLGWLVPGVGHALYVAVAWLLTSFFFALDYIDWPAARRGIGVRQRLGLFSERPWLMLGFGAAVWGCLFVPVLNVAFMPIAVAGGTRLFLDLESELQAIRANKR
jgi:CysZ protein